MSSFEQRTPSAFLASGNGRLAPFLLRAKGYGHLLCFERRAPYTLFALGKSCTRHLLRFEPRALLAPLSLRTMPRRTAQRGFGQNSSTLAPERPVLPAASLPPALGPKALQSQVTFRSSFPKPPSPASRVAFPPPARRKRGGSLRTRRRLQKSRSRGSKSGCESQRGCRRGLEGGAPWGGSPNQHPPSPARRATRSKSRKAYRQAGREFRDTTLTSPRQALREPSFPDTPKRL